MSFNFLVKKTFQRYYLIDIYWHYNDIIMIIDIAIIYSYIFMIIMI